jgi:hypothetical protein
MHCSTTMPAGSEEEAATKLGLIIRRLRLRYHAPTTTAGILLSCLTFITYATFAEETAKVDAGTNAANPVFSVLPRQDELIYYPCSDCHEFMDPNNEVRLLDADPDHPQQLDHGAGEIWCLSCHGPWPYDQLRTLMGEPVAYNDSQRTCGGCHSHKLRDWRRGAHGKRLANWRGERQLNGCPACHNPHRPAVAPRAPLAPPPVRAGLERVDGKTVPQRQVWESRAQELRHE